MSGAVAFGVALGFTTTLLMLEIYYYIMHVAP